MKKTHFFSQDKTAYAILLFLLIMLSDIMAVILGFGGAVVLLFSLGSDMPVFSSYESLIISAFAICLILLTALYAYRNNHPKKLKAIAAANLIMSLLSIMMNSLYYPFPDMISHTIYRITGIEYFRTSALDHYMSLFVSVPMCILCFILLLKLKRGNEESAGKASFRRTVRVTVTVFALVTVGGLAVCNILPSEAYNHSGIVNMAERAEAVIDGTLQKSRAEKLFDSITGDTEYSQADIILREEGFIPHTDIEEYIKDKEELEIEIDNLKELLCGQEVIAYTKPHDGYISYYNSCIIISPSEDGKVEMKKITYNAASSYKSDESKEVFEMLKIGDEKDRTLKKMKKVSDISSYSVEYGENTVKESYEFSAINDVSFLHLVDITYFNAVIVFENSILKDGNYTYATETNADTDDVVCTEKKYTISE